jgi:hypothetical protein
MFKMNAIRRLLLILLFIYACHLNAISQVKKVVPKQVTIWT